MATADAKAFSHDLANVFQSSGWKVSSPMVMGISNSPPTGVGLMVLDANCLTDAERAVKRSFEAADIIFDIQTRTRKQHPIADPNVEILLTTKIH